MKKIVCKITALAVLAMAMVAFTSCNKDMFDTNYTFDEAIIETGEGVITVDIKQWTDYEDGDQIQITAKDGTVYLVHSSRVTLINYK